MKTYNHSYAKSLARQVRIESLKMVHAANASHIGGSLSVTDILAVLYSGILQVNPHEPDHPLRDRLIYSKGHACSALYAVLALREFFPVIALEQFGKNGSKFITHASHYVPGVELSSGSLGHGLPVACGLMIGARCRKETWKTYVVVSDGELDEGSNWEAILFAGHHKLSNLILTIDYNRFQSFGEVENILALEPLCDKFISFRWLVKMVDGHNIEELEKAYREAINQKSSPTCIIANTTKGKGVDFMENQLMWHYRSPSSQLLQQAIDQLESK